MARQTLAQVYFNRRMLVLLGLGFASGLPSAYKLLGDTVAAWLTDLDYDVKTIGLFALVGLPFTFNFVWAPLLDRFVPPLLGRRRGWLLIIQVLLICAIAAMAFAGPVQRDQSLMVFAMAALVVAWLAASQDVVADAYRTDVLPTAERGAGAACYVNGYRIAMLAAGGGAILLSDILPWRVVYLLLAAMMVIGILATLVAPRPSDESETPQNITDAVINPIGDFFRRYGGMGLTILLFVVLFKLPDALANKMVMPLLQKHLQFTKPQIVLVREWLGLAATVIGAFAGGAISARWSLRRSLLLFGVLQASSNAGYCVLAMTGTSVTVLTGVIVIENFSAGLVTTGFIAFLMSLCNRRYSATQYALFTSLSFFTASTAGALTGFAVEAVGYIWFYALTVAAGVPGMVLLIWIRIGDSTGSTLAATGKPSS